ncbi:MAG TPA: hypothetical protein VGL22_19435, partial [Terracidiphilus sp.]
LLFPSVDEESDNPENSTVSLQSRRLRSRHSSAWIMRIAYRYATAGESALRTKYVLSVVR